MHVGLFFGSFNPVHIGHLAIANYMLAYADMDQLWFVVSPHNPLKKKQTLLPEADRLHLVNLAIEAYPQQYRASNIEFKMPTPSYTIDTLARLSDKYPQHKFSLIMGSDNLESFRKWKNRENIVARYHRYIYPRPGTAHLSSTAANATAVDAPLIEISSTFIRTAIMQGRDVPFFMPEKVYRYIREMHFYETKQSAPPSL
ncbi:MAG: nicotinate-nucleotide adenylyltransferase [Bacteroidales bacterium]|jgi:nicotinate-nucleotide adenylyltransferase|nr:nicotinate-nucleotide adenylyltransferase [Bacteroidales bacterium]